MYDQYGYNVVTIRIAHVFSLAEVFLSYYRNAEGDYWLQRFCGIDGDQFYVIIEPIHDRRSCEDTTLKAGCLLGIEVSEAIQAPPNFKLLASEFVRLWSDARPPVPIISKGTK